MEIGFVEYDGEFLWANQYTFSVDRSKCMNNFQWQRKKILLRNQKEYNDNRRVNFANPTIFRLHILFLLIWYDWMLIYTILMVLNLLYKSNTFNVGVVGVCARVKFHFIQKLIDKTCWLFTLHDSRPTVKYTRMRTKA